MSIISVRNPFRTAAICAVPALFLLPLIATAQRVQTHPTVTQAENITTRVPFRDMTPVPWRNENKEMLEHRRSGAPHVSNEPDSVVQTLTLPPVWTINKLNFEGINGNQGGGFIPPDTNASVGATQVVETVNIAFAVYDKTTGHTIMGPRNIQTLYQPLGGQCASGNLSDPVVNYDKVAQRWVITMIAFNGNFSQNDSCVAVSTTSDATGTYHLYAFSYNNVLPDYPKVGVWPDAYYLTTDSYPNGNNFVGVDACALERTKMLAGQPAKSICFQRGPTDYSMLPADVDGSTASAPWVPVKCCSSSTRIQSS